MADVTTCLEPSKT